MVKLHTFKLKHDDITEKETFDVEKLDGTTIEILLSLWYCFRQCLQEWSLKVKWCSLILISVFWIMHLKNGAQLLHIKTTKHLKISSFPLENGSMPYCLIMISLSKRNWWQTQWRSHTSRKWKTFVTFTHVTPFSFLVLVELMSSQYSLWKYFHLESQGGTIDSNKTHCFATQVLRHHTLLVSPTADPD